MKTNETIINIYVDDNDIQNKFFINRLDDIDEDYYQERCDEVEMSIHDIDIAIIQKEKTRYCIFTSSNLWNVYLSKEQLNENGDWETIDMNNLTSDIDDWETVQDLTSYLLDLNLNEQYKQKNIVEFLEDKIRKDERVLSDAFWLDTITFYVQFNLSSDELKKYFYNMIDDQDGDCYLSAEYHEDEHKFVYELIFDEDKFNMDNEMQSTIIDWYILEQARTF